MYSSPIYGYFGVNSVNKSCFMVNVVSRTFPLDLIWITDMITNKITDRITDKITDMTTKQN